MLCEFSAALINLFGLVLALLIFLIVIKKFFGNSWKESDRETAVECKLLILEESLLDKVAEKRGLDLDKALVKATLTQRESFRKKVYDEIIKEALFDKKEKK